MRRSEISGGRRSDSKGEYSDWMSVAIGTLDTPFLSKKQKHVCVASKAPWYAIEDQWPRME